MRIQAIILTVALATATGLRAETVRIRTGDHERFTRIVVDFTDRPEWRLGRSEQGHELRVPDEGTEFDLSQAFRRIGRSRIANLRDLGAGRLGIDVACDCSLRTYELPNEHLVIDVTETPPRPDDPYEETLDPERGNVTPPDTASFPFAFKPAPPRLLPGGIGPRIAGDGPGVLVDRHIEETRERVAEGVARAAGQGLLTVRGDPLVPREPDPQPVPEAESPPQDTLPQELRDRENMRLRTSIDRDIGAAMAERPIGAPSRCLSDSAVDVGAWGPADGAGDGVSDLRADLIDEAGHADPEAYAALARRYIHLTFGAEARALLSAAPAETPSLDLLATLADVTEAQPVRSRVLRGQGACDGAVALWALLAAPAPDQVDPLSTKAVVAAFSDLPLHQRRHLGPRLGEIFLARGDRSTALAIRDAVQRGGPEDSPDQTMMQAKLDIDSGETSRVETDLAPVAEGTSSRAAEALLTLIDLRMADDETVGPDLIESAEALAFDLAGTPEAARLTAAGARALIHDGRIQDALDKIEQLGDGEALAPETLEALQTDALTALLEETDDAEFLRMSLPLLDTDLPRTARRDLARRFLSLDLPGQARRALDIGAVVPTPAERLILAEVALREGKGEIAESYLVGLDMPEARDLTAELEARRDRVQATNAQAETEGTETAPTGVLARNRDLLDQSRAARERLDALLAETGG
ncbi:hypothetical protein [Tranquillimonas rosea]|uniref:hypothetical protein n=1 Tax=Tranquillimonas rosea TaxID=641238 RepID=UPI003BAD32CE